jgi:hypothetical protein
MRAPQGIYELLLSGSGTFDEQVRLWITARGDEFFSSVFGSLFSDEAGGTFANDKSFEQLFGDRRYGADAALAVFLLAQRLESDVPEGVQMPLAQYKVILNEYRVAAVNRLALALSWHETCLKLGTMVLEYNPTSRTVVVVGDVYRRWLEAGGTPEVLAGALISGDAGYTAASVEEKKADYLEALETFLSMNAVAKRNDSFDTFQRALREGFEISMRNTTAQESEMVQQSQYREEADARFEESLEGLKSSDMADTAAVCLAVLGKSRFYYSDAAKFLASMEQAAKSNPKIDAREAALIATIEYIADYMADQIEVV